MVAAMVNGHLDIRSPPGVSRVIEKFHGRGPAIFVKVPMGLRPGDEVQVHLRWNARGALLAVPTGFVPSHIERTIGWHRQSFRKSVIGSEPIYWGFHFGSRVNCYGVMGLYP